MHGQVLIPFEIGIVIAPVMRQIGTYQYNITGMESLDMIAYELCAAAMMKIDQLHFCMVMPAVIDKRIPVFPDAE